MKKFLVVTLLLITTVLFSGDRSPEWRKVRKAYAEQFPICAICNTNKDINVHHIKPFHLYPHLELEPTNLVTLCRSKYLGFNCHMHIGHGGNFKYYNPWLKQDIQNLRNIIENNDSTYWGFLFEEYVEFVKERVKIFNCIQYNKCFKKHLEEL